MAVKSREVIEPEIQKLALEKLRELLAKPKEIALSGKMAFIKLAEPEIAGLLEKGYTMKEIIASLDESGIKFTTGTINSYWKRVKADKAAVVVPKAAKTPKPESTVVVAPVTQPSESGDSNIAKGTGLESTVNVPTVATSSVSADSGIAQKAAISSPPGTGTSKPTDLKAGKELLYGKKNK